MTSIEELATIVTEKVSVICETGYKRLEGALAGLQNGPRGRVVSSNVVLATWEDRPTWLTETELMEVSLLFGQREAVTQITLSMLTDIYRVSRFDQRLTPSFAIGKDGRPVGVLVKKP